MKKRIKVLRVVIGLNQGGVQQGIFNLFQGLDKTIFEPIACAIENTGAIGEEIVASGYEVIVLNYQRQTWKTIRALVKLMKERQIDIVHASSYHPSFYARTAAILAGVPVILGYEHVMFDRRRLQRVLLNRLLAPWTDGYTAVGKAVSDQVCQWYGYAPDKVKVVHNGVDVERFHPPQCRRAAKETLGLDPNRLVVGMMCRMDLEKGHRYFFEAIQALKQTYDVQWVVVGMGREEPAIHEQAKSLGVSDDVQFWGLRRDVPDVLRAFDIYVFPTLKEGFPNSLLEAMASGNAVVASDFPGNLEVARDRANALIAPMQDARALKEHIETLITDESQRNALSAQARSDIVEHFSLQRYAKKMSELYLQFCKEKGII